MKKAVRWFLEEFLQIQYLNRIIFKLHYKTKRAEDNIITGHNSNNLEAFLFSNKNETQIRSNSKAHFNCPSKPMNVTYNIELEQFSRITHAWYLVNNFKFIRSPWIRLKPSININYNCFWKEQDENPIELLAFRVDMERFNTENSLLIPKHQFSQTQKSLRWQKKMNILWLEQLYKPTKRLKLWKPHHSYQCKAIKFKKFPDSGCILEGKEGTAS